MLALTLKAFFSFCLIIHHVSLESHIVTIWNYMQFNTYSPTPFLMDSGNDLELNACICDERVYSNLKCFKKLETLFECGCHDNKMLLMVHSAAF